jgi:hypothetical protein
MRRMTTKFHPPLFLFFPLVTEHFDRFRILTLADINVMYVRRLSHLSVGASVVSNYRPRVLEPNPEPGNNVFICEVCGLGFRSAGLRSEKRCSGDAGKN